MGIAARQAVEREAASLSYISTAGLTGTPGCPPNSSDSVASPEQMRTALLNPFLRREIEALLYEGNRRIGAIDHDIAVMRSFSLSAKIVYQRQRNVKERIKELRDGDGYWPWQKIQRLVLRGLGIKLL
ncbi:MAG: hypothetical protein IT537_03290 [Hyphomicrobiales bacterium]|nr:hypothetical protein [Hyphomicrobiales bacterium]